MMSTMIADMRIIPLFTVNAPYASTNKVGSWVPVAGLQDATNLEYIVPG